MTDIRAKVAYLHGLAEGLEIETTTAEGRVLTSMIDVLGDIADQVAGMAEAQQELVEYMEDVDFDLGALEESLYDEEADEQYPEVTFVPEELMTHEEEGVQFVSCPQCGETLAAGAGELNAVVEAICPTCGCVVAEGDLEYVEEE